ncbi:hypothetical protein RM543_10410 [Roseicyclus sp. F158]|uniref:N-acetyltransferase domain-containing protein n=1 Tax=Tropicimonas omnivorans TaxID=3075590 RepID=A0ABU3DHU0_9RHOB|nr:hypothetical protein [Roseicyclus sp. F158]MDT0683099.1 hypothetical protein [Roseicyclus sp. F158]
MLRWLKTKTITYQDFAGAPDKLVATIRYCIHGGKPYMLTLSRAPDCYVKKGPHSIATFETLSIKDRTLHVDHFAVDRNLQGSGVAEIVLRGFAQLVAEQTPEISQITFDLHRSAGDSDIQKLSDARFALLNRMGAQEVSMRKPNTHCICVWGRWDKSRWTK